MLLVRTNLNPHLLTLLAVLFLLADPLAAAPAGPTLRLDYGSNTVPANLVSEFMYFVPLISPEPVSIFTNSGNTQCARVISFHCQTNGETFQAVCEFEFTGQGFQQNQFDHARLIERRKPELAAGGSIKHHLDAINVEGAGSGSVEIEGTQAGGQRVVTEVTMRFNRHGHLSPVTIDLSDICWQDGAARHENPVVARVNSLVFKRKTGPPKMEVTLASVKRKDAGDSLWQSFIGGIKGATANLFLPPLSVEAEGHQAMLDFGLALATGKSAFTFPFAPRLKTGTAPAR